MVGIFEDKEQASWGVGGGLRRCCLRACGDSAGWVQSKAKRTDCAAGTWGFPQRPEGAFPSSNDLAPHFVIVRSRWTGCG